MIFTILVFPSSFFWRLHRFFILTVTTCTTLPYSYSTKFTNRLKKIILFNPLLQVCLVVLLLFHYLRRYYLSQEENNDISSQFIFGIILCLWEKPKGRDFSLCSRIKFENWIHSAVLKKRIKCNLILIFCKEKDLSGYKNIMTEFAIFFRTLYSTYGTKIILYLRCLKKTTN